MISKYRRFRRNFDSLGVTDFLCKNQFLGDKAKKNIFNVDSLEVKAKKLFFWAKKNF